MSGKRIQGEPKTDYTYSKTASYLKRSPSKGYISPNMARRSLHRSDPHITVTFPNELIKNSAGEVHIRHSLPVAGPSNAVSSGCSSEPRAGVANTCNSQGNDSNSGLRRQISFEASPDSRDGTRDAMGSASVTRSGTRYNKVGAQLKVLQRQCKSTKAQARSLTYEDEDVCSEFSSRMDKSYEYAGQPLICQEKNRQTPQLTPAHVTHLYGLEEDSTCEEEEEEEEMLVEEDESMIDDPDHQLGGGARFVQCSVSSASVSSTLSCLITSACMFTMNTIWTMFCCFFMGLGGCVSCTLSDFGRLLSHFILFDTKILYRVRKVPLYWIYLLVCLIPLLIVGCFYLHQRGTHELVDLITHPNHTEPAGAANENKAHGLLWSFLMLLKSCLAAIWNRTTPEDISKNVTCDKATLGSMKSGLLLSEAELEKKIRDTFIFMYGDKVSANKTKKKKVPTATLR